jgi:hypothetical protein
VIANSRLGKGSSGVLSVLRVFYILGAWGTHSQHRPTTARHALSHSCSTSHTSSHSSLHATDVPSRSCVCPCGVRSPLCALFWLHLLLPRMAHTLHRVRRDVARLARLPTARAARVPCSWSVARREWHIRLKGRRCRLADGRGGRPAIVRAAVCACCATPIVSNGSRCLRMLR